MPSAPTIRTPGRSDRPPVGQMNVLVTRLKKRGNETPEDPTRNVTQVWTMDGELLAEHDPCSRVPLGWDPDWMLRIVQSRVMTHRLTVGCSAKDALSLAETILKAIQILPDGELDCSGDHPVWVPAEEPQH